MNRILESNGLSLKKRFGQNFLINDDARRRIIDSLGIVGGETVWEIGPGIGSLTVELAKRDISLTVFEIDHGFVRLLEDAFADRERVTIVEGDFIDEWQRVRDRSGGPDIIVGNLPYSSASAMFVSLIEGRCAAHRIVSTVQKEAAARMTALPGSPDYTSFSVLCSLSWRVKRLGDLGPGSFFPPPRVSSSILSLEPAAGAYDVSAPELVAGVRALFAGRRKTIRNNLRMAYPGKGPGLRALWEEAEQRGVDLERRPETLPPEKIAELVGVLKKARI